MNYKTSLIQSSLNTPDIIVNNSKEQNQYNQSILEDSIATEQNKGFIGLWKKSGFLILTLVRKFILNTQELSMKYKFRFMERKYFELIKDNTCDYQYYQLRGMFDKDKPQYLKVKWNEF